MRKHLSLQGCRLTPEELQEIMIKKTWHFAKTMPYIPHEYARRSEWGDNEQFSWIVGFINVFGRKEKFYKKSYIYLYLTEYKYWTMGQAHTPLDKIEIINRAKYDK